MSDMMKALDGIQNGINAMGARIDSIEKAQNLATEQTSRRLPVADAGTAGSKFAGLSGSDVAFLHDLVASGAALGLRPSEELVNASKALNRPSIIMPAAKHGNFRPWTKATLNEGASGYGQQLVPVQYVSELWDAARERSKIFGQIRSFEMTAPSAYLPVAADLPEPALVSENTTANSFRSETARAGSNNVAVTAKTMLFNQVFTEELEEDSLIPFVPFLRQMLADAVAFYSDAVILNGDTTNAATGNINSDDADPADTKYYLAFDGLRHVGLVDNTANGSDCGGALTLAKLAALKGLMVDKTYLIDWGHPANAEDLIFVADPGTADAIGLLDQAVTVDKFGPQAGVKMGQIANILGNPVIATMAMGLTEADGKISDTAANNTKGQVVLFNRAAFAVGIRKQISFDLVRDPRMGQISLVSRFRLGFGRYAPSGSASSINGASVLYNISL
jgi:HK97 family phage major capsid protein